MDNPELYYPKELSWLAFNERVLQEAADKNNPVVERIRFLGIYSNNLDEFYRVRAADVKRQITIAQNDGNEEEAEKQTALMAIIQQKVVQLSDKFDHIHKDVLKALARYNIHILRKHELNDYQKQWVRNFFVNKVLRHIAPIIIDKKMDLLSRLNGTSVYLYVALRRKDRNTRYAVIQVPTSDMSRFMLIPPEKSRKKKHIIMLDDMIQLCLEDIFRGFVKFDEVESFSFKMTRDAEYSINDEIDESYVEKMSESMKQRLIAEPVRVIYDNDMPEDMMQDLRKRLRITKLDTMHAAGHYRNFKDFIGFPNVGREYLEHAPLPAIDSNAFSKFNTVFDAITAHDILLYYPYHRFLHVTEFVRQAAFDPSVKVIRINIYRVASNSRIINSLIDAVDNGKKVTVVVELRARFDEEANIEWSKRMTDAGIRVVLGVPTLKIHSKLCVITREERGAMINYAHFGTGNFNEKTAKIYTDYSLFTRNQELANEAVAVFDLIQYPFRRYKFQHLQISPLNARTRIQSLIRQEIQHLKEGRPAQITFKINNLVDNELMDDLYRASQAGVKIRGIVRGMCSLIPGLKGISENIEIISIVDRFLEHPRVMVFEGGGERKVFISSADWMTRNMDNRIEVGCPIYDKNLQQRIVDIMDIQFRDTLKARVIDKEQSNKYVARGNRKKLRSQIEIYDYLVKEEEKEAGK
ncbi:polyphosphate kinase 1 [Alteromonas stellipolaris]|jgi:polyphosphate kinase|uniref:polyphosphate kinase 1 n=1 Tax=Alteromonas stellipolaris TaxID=233316 RepID=UPI0007702FF1|nr:polyphosphate kinase 1 [Alteromonas stellipolaris]AMJ93554.1 RNA degradosome polyphosphate kinase [Alteromonas stellipolaris]ANB26201.1 RNA degradosome polyphosphate kinase [Alteromonas stellipolaris]MBZ2161564.1 polyphosphate kinase 1 [Alteromonas stellipolaris]MDO6537106.1 polyphosphate kinase 1 [Alteromonas stellipolaris]MDP2536016.1 polyphosphate kinase 1 [Alteromonas stellipolaris]